MIKLLKNPVLALALATLAACTSTTGDSRVQGQPRDVTNVEKVTALLNSFNTGDTSPIAYINPDKYIQHNLDVADGLAGFGEVMQNAPPQGFSANVKRVFADGDFVVAHTEYDFFGPKAGFDVFRFENGLIVEHWDNLSPVTPPNPSGRTQFDGTMTINDRDQTEANKVIVRRFIDDILINGKTDLITDYVSTETYIQHNSAVADGLDGLGAALAYFAENDMVMIYDQTHNVLGEGNFVLAMSEGKFGPAPGQHVAYYDLFRLDDGKIVEHWDVIQNIPPSESWKNDNGKF
ncbi:MAG: nuclear transport factor 2 family protein [Pseudomonadota bacterium]